MNSIENRISELEKKRNGNNILIGIVLIFPEDRIDILIRNEVKEFKKSEPDKIKDFLRTNNITHLFNTKILF
jgi:hypothetical protein